LKHWKIPAGIVVVLLALWLAWPSRSWFPTAHQRGNERGAPGSTAAPPQASAAVPLRNEIPPQRPPADQLQANLQKAASGDPLAACEVGELLRECRWIRQASIAAMTDATVQRLARAREAAVDPRQIELLASALEGEAHYKAACKHVDDELLAQHWAYDLQAAQAGFSGSALRFLGGESFDEAALIASPGLPAAFRTHAFPIFLDQLERGNVQMGMLWLLASSDDPQLYVPLRTVLPQEWKQSGAAHALVAELIARGQVAGGTELLRAVGHGAPGAQASAFGAHVFSRYFGGHTDSTSDAARLEKAEPCRNRSGHAG
jgi:hypothetical protein